MLKISISMYCRQDKFFAADSEMLKEIEVSELIFLFSANVILKRCFISGK
ncbi:hypothetical protein AQPE_3158 [Aquipluma nitroreducens]|uniref:Uncharacterized protein n=1 Tax=Aquipluma nitroreducens TaxID=2010828 RepID=A0A5K7SBW5_9BACT|nr:hypothetical protein AQPE_3158 [Aquipluma nitroreducens]